MGALNPKDHILNKTRCRSAGSSQRGTSQALTGMEAPQAARTPGLQPEAEGKTLLGKKQS